MDNFDLEKLLSENYCDTLNSLEPVNKERLYKLYKKPKASKIGRRTFVYKIAIAVLLLSLLAVGTVTATASNAAFRDKLAQRAKKDNVNLTDSELDEITSRVTQRGWFDESEALTEFGRNENGQMYGSDLYGFELMAVGGTGDNVGYVYTVDFNDEMFTGPGQLDDDSESSRDFYYDDVLEWQEDRDSGELRNWCYAFEKDGMTIIGKWVQSIKKDDEEISEKRINMGFLTNEELASGEYDKYIYDGFDSVIDEAEVMERLEKLHVNVGNKAAFPADEELPEMGENDKRQKYGDFRYNFELQPCSGYYKGGYCYTDDCKEVQGTRIPWLYDISEWDKVRKNTRNWNYVYESDGETIIGVEYGRPVYVENTQDDYELYGGFCTIEEFESGEYDEYIYNGGDDGEKYKEKARKRQIYFDKLRELGHTH